MEETCLERYRAAWKSEKSFEKVPLTEAAIQALLKKRSRDINRLFRGSLLTDILLKSLIGTSFAVLPFLFPGSPGISVLCSWMIAGILMAVFYQVRMLRKIPHSD